MNGFIESIDSWRDFYMLTGSASATLVGLIFVAVTLHIDVIAEAKKSSDIRMLAEEIFITWIAARVPPTLFPHTQIQLK
jgi:hypothetical protein